MTPYRYYGILKREPVEGENLQRLMRIDKDGFCLLNEKDGTWHVMFTERDVDFFLEICDPFSVIKTNIELNRKLAVKHFSEKFMGIGLDDPSILQQTINS
jgi:hypothetical protein